MKKIFNFPYYDGNKMFKCVRYYNGDFYILKKYIFKKINIKKILKNGKNFYDEMQYKTIYNIYISSFHKRYNIL